MVERSVSKYEAGEETFLAERSIDTSIQEVLSMQNQKNVESYAALMEKVGRVEEASG